MAKTPVCLMILDGYGIAPASDKNAISIAKTPVMDKFLSECPKTELAASGMDVGLPEGQMGNSEVGHTYIGAGRIVYQELTRITKSITDGDFYENEALCAAMDNCAKNGSKLHVAGLLSDGGVHSHNTHLYALLDMAKKKGLTKVYVHAILDGRDVPPNSGLGFVNDLESEIAKIGTGKIATVMGRFYAMDRDNSWERVSKAYDAMTLGKGEVAETAAKAVEESYAKEVYDEFVVPAVIEKDATIDSGDSVIFFNFRPDRAREITRTFVDKEFTGFAREKAVDVFYVCMTQYDATMPNVEVAFKPEKITNTLGEIVSANGLNQLRIAETEKYAHVTFFFNGGVEAVSEGEDRELIASPKVATYDLKPEMSAYEVADKAVECIEKDKYDVIILNFANCDMVGHTGFMDAAVKAVEAVDECVGKVVGKILEKGGKVFITADHGNADCMFDEAGNTVTAHSLNQVPLYHIAKQPVQLADGGKLADLAPTLLDLMGLEIPEEMTGRSLVVR